MSGAENWVVHAAARRLLIAAIDSQIRAADLAATQATFAEMWQDATNPYWPEWDANPNGLLHVWRRSIVERLGDVIEHEVG